MMNIDAEKSITLDTKTENIVLLLMLDSILDILCEVESCSVLTKMSSRGCNEVSILTASTLYEIKLQFAFS